MSDTPTREQVQEALDHKFLATEAPWTNRSLDCLSILYTIGRLWLEGPQVDEAMIERGIYAIQYEDFGPWESRALVKSVLQAALEVTDGPEESH